MKAPRSKEQTARPRRFRSLKSVLTLTLLTLSVTTLVVVSGFNLFLNYRTQQQALNSQMSLVAQRAADTVSRQIEAKVGSLTSTAASSDLVSADPDKSRSTLARIVGLDHFFNQIVLWDMTGKELGRVCRGAEVICRQSVSSLSDEAINALKTGPSYVGPVFIDPESSEPMMIIAVPVQNVFKESIGVLTAEVKLKFMWDLVGSLRVGQGGTAYVVDDRGNLIAFADASRVIRLENLAEIPEVARFLRMEATGTSGLFTAARGINGTAVASAHTEIASPHWAVVVEIPVREAYADVINAAVKTVLVMLLGILASVLIGYYLARRITLPIMELRDAAGKMSRGDLTIRIHSRAGNEIGELAADFNSMAERIKVSYEELEKKVEERTHELAERTVSLAETNADLKMSQEQLNLALETVKREKTVAEREHKRSETILRSIGDGVFVVDAGGRLTMVNQAAAAMVSDQGDATGRHYSEVFTFRTEKGGEDVSSFVFEAMRINGVTQPEAEVLLVLKGGASLPVTVGAAPLIDEDGASIGAVTVIRDETHEREISRMKSDFISIASHQLRTPLTAIKWSIELIDEDDTGHLSDAQKESLADVQMSVSRLARLVNDLLNVSRIERGRISLMPKLANVDDLCRDAVKEAIPIARGKRQTLENGATGLGTVNMDVKLVFQVLANLLSNAIKYTPEGGRITVGGRRTGDEVEIFVRDNGLGVPASAKDKLFQKFYRADNATAAGIEGTGLGLFLAKAIINSSGGKMWYESECGQGSTFWFSLPIAGVESHQGDRSLVL